MNESLSIINYIYMKELVEHLSEEERKQMIYKTLLNKGFKPVYYTNNDWFKRRECNSRLFYRYEVTTKELLSSILNIFNIYNKYFLLLENEDLITHIEVDEDLEEYWIYFYNADVDNFEISKDKLDELFNVIPNGFTLEHCD